MTKRTCTMPDCNKAHRARGLCSSHYNAANPSPNRHAKKLVPCAYCGTEVIKGGGGGRVNGSVCSNECRQALQMESFPARSKLPDDHWARWFGKASAWPRFGWRACAQCDAPIAATSAVSKYCSRRCMWQWLDKKNGVTPMSELLALERNCARCGSMYQHQAMSRLHCTDLCRELDRKDRGVALHRGWISKAERDAIYERDGYECWLCNKPCDLDADMQRDNWAPTLDHVVPRSQGGGHEWTNLRTAHRWCNSMRSDSGLDRIESDLEMSTT